MHRSACMHPRIFNCLSVYCHGYCYEEKILKPKQNQKNPKHVTVHMHTWQIVYFIYALKLFPPFDCETVLTKNYNGLWIMGWRVGSEIRSMQCSFRRHKFHSQPPWWAIYHCLQHQLQGNPLPLASTRTCTLMQILRSWRLPYIELKKRKIDLENHNHQINIWQSPHCACSLQRSWAMLSLLPKFPAF